MFKNLFGKFSRKPTLHRFNVRNKQEGIHQLILQTQRWVKAGNQNKVLLVNDRSEISEKIEQSFRKSGYSMLVVNLKDIDEVKPEDIVQVGCIVAGFFDPRYLHKLGSEISRKQFLGRIPFEFIIIPVESYPTLIKHDWQQNTDFISPLLLSGIDYFKLYEESLVKFERKCQIRDYLDLCQLIQMTLERNVDGDIAEFGSYKGHSGYLIAKILKHFGSLKNLYLFDMFEHFPNESHGIDAFWNKTHYVNFDDVKAKFSEFDQVHLVKGDFTETFIGLDIRKLSIVYIDCDSYRGTQFLLNTIYDKHLSRNGIIILEDYGHGALLGNRVAFHEFFDKRNDCFKFFSHFSGFQIVVKCNDVA